MYSKGHVSKTLIISYFSLYNLKFITPIYNLNHFGINILFFESCNLENNEEIIKKAYFMNFFSINVKYEKLFSIFTWYVRILIWNSCQRKFKKSIDAVRWTRVFWIVDTTRLPINANHDFASELLFLSFCSIKSKTFIDEHGQSSL